VESKKIKTKQNGNMEELVAGALIVGAVGAAAAGAAGAGSAWLLNRKMKKRRKKLALRLFGLPLDVLLPVHITGTGVPVIVDKTCDEIEKRGLSSPSPLPSLQLLLDASL